LIFFSLYYYMPINRRFAMKKICEIIAFKFHARGGKHKEEKGGGGWGSGQLSGGRGQGAGGRNKFSVMRHESCVMSHAS
jgi:hypothetical protein